MQNQMVTQAVVTQQKEMTAQGGMLLSLFNPDGTPVTLGGGGGGSGVSVPGANMSDVTDSLMFSNPSGDSSWEALPGPYQNGLFEEDGGDYHFTKSGLFSIVSFFQIDNVTTVADKAQLRYEVGNGGYGATSWFDTSSLAVGDSLPLVAINPDTLIVSAAAGQKLGLNSSELPEASSVSIMAIVYPLLLIES